MTDTSDLVAAVLRDGGRRLASYGLALTGSAHEADDLVQAAIVKTFVKRRRLRDERAAEAYVRATMRTLHVDRVRREATWRRLVPSFAWAEPVVDHASDIVGEDEVTRLLATLPPRVRTVAALRYFDDLTLGDIAHAMRLSEGTVKKYLQEARDRLAAVAGLDAEEAETSPVMDRGAR